LNGETLLLTERFGMKRLAVESIIVPAEDKVPVEPSVSPEDPITDAIEVMLKHNLKQIAVTEENRAIGMIRLEDALKKVGLEGDIEPKGKRTVVFQGRKVTLEK
jgi:predicted transcriptional regulator